VIRWLYLLLAAVLFAPASALAQAVSAAPELPRGAAVVVRAKPIAEPSTWVVTDDYPAAAKRAGQEGRVGFTLVVGTEGRAVGCTVAESSGSASLDSATCALLMRRARFVSAADKKRASIPDRWVGIIDWKLTPDQHPPPPSTDCNDCGVPWTMTPDDLYAPKPRGDPARWLRPADYPAKWRKTGGSITVVLRLRRDGSVRACKVSASSGSVRLDGLVCALLRQRARFRPEREEAAKWTSLDWEHRYAWAPRST
jgi:TonB family protein